MLNDLFSVASFNATICHMKTFRPLILLPLLMLFACTTAVSTPPSITPAPALLPIPIASPTLTQPFFVNITAVSTHDVTSRLPAYFTYAVTGGDISSVTLVMQGQDGERLIHRPLTVSEEVIFGMAQPAMFTMAWAMVHLS